MPRDRGPVAEALHIGLRFERSQAPMLHELADRARRRELGQEQVTLFAMAADAATTGEPLIVACANELEVVLIAKGFSRFGVLEPSIEQVQGGGGPPDRCSRPR